MLFSIFSKNMHNFEVKAKLAIYSNYNIIYELDPHLSKEEFEKK